MLSYYYGVANLFPDMSIIPGVAKKPYVTTSKLLKGVNPDWPELPEKYVFAAQTAQGLYLELLKQIRIEIKDPYGVPIFFQLEEGENGKLHFHWMISTMVGTARDLGQIIKTAETQFNHFWLGTRGITYFKPNKNRNGSWSTTNSTFLQVYLLPKLPLKDVLWAWSNLDGKEGEATLNQTLRKEFLDMKKGKTYLTTNTTSDDEDDEHQAPIYKHQSGVQVKTLLNFMVENDITTEEKYQNRFMTSYCSYIATQNGTHLLKQTLQLAKTEIARNKPLALTLCGFKSRTELLTFLNEYTPQSMEESKIWKLFLENGYDPDEAAAVFFAWAYRLTGKRNAIWISGPPTTGKSNLAQAIARTAASYGCVNWNNPHFPFQDIINTQLALWDEGRLDEAIIEQTKSLLSGIQTRIDRKCTTSKETTPPPFLITSNCDITLVYSGNMTTTLHRQALEDRILHFTFSTKCKPDFGLLTTNDVKNFMKWGAWSLMRAKHNRYSLIRKGPTTWPCHIPQQATETQLGYVLRKKPLWPTTNEEEDIIYIEDDEILKAAETAEEAETENIDSILEDPNTDTGPKKVRVGIIPNTTIFAAH
ncbi:NS1 [Bosavirus sp.]|nr:NS1 [Bosavirus sp.]